jgi:integrase
LPRLPNKSDRGAGVITLVETKNGEGRTIPIRGPLVAVVERAWKARAVDGRISEWVFHDDCRRVGWFWRRWHAARMAAGYPEKLFHDLRRTAIRDMVRAGVPEKVAMSLSGHKTRTVFDRYNIANECDREQAQAVTAEYRAAAGAGNVVHGHFTDTEGRNRQKGEQTLRL